MSLVFYFITALAISFFIFIENIIILFNRISSSYFFIFLSIFLVLSLFIVFSTLITFLAGLNCFTLYKSKNRLVFEKKGHSKSFFTDLIMLKTSSKKEQFSSYHYDIYLFQDKDGNSYYEYIFTYNKNIISRLIKTSPEYSKIILLIVLEYTLFNSIYIFKNYTSTLNIYSDFWSICLIIIINLIFLFLFIVYSSLVYRSIMDTNKQTIRNIKSKLNFQK